MKSKHSSNKATAALVAGTVALFAGWSTSALSATTERVESDAISRDLRSLEIPAETFSVRPVDHVLIGTDTDPHLASLDIADATGESSAPFLYLTPRVASVLRDIFDATGEGQDKNIDFDVPSSPVAESESVSDGAEMIDESDPVTQVDEIDLPLFQQQMFRTDI